MHQNYFYFNFSLNKIKYTSFILLAILFSPLVIFSQHSNLKILPGSRAAGMGFAYTAVAENNLALFWNPAAIAISPRKELSLGISQDRSNSTVPFYLQFAVASLPIRNGGAWAIGSYAIKNENVEYAISIAHARRLNRFFRIGLSIFHKPDLLKLPKNANQWGGAIGMTFQPNTKLRLAATLHSTLNPIINKNLNFQEDPWTQFRLGFAWRFLRSAIVSFESDLLSKTNHFGLELKVFSSFYLRSGMSVNSSFNQLFSNKLGEITFHGGISFGIPGLNYGAIQKSENGMLHNISLRAEYGKIIRQLAVKSKLFGTNIENQAGLQATVTPNLTSAIPKEVKHRVTKKESLGDVQNRLQKILKSEYASDTLAILKYNKYPPNKAFQQNQIIRLPLYNWVQDDSLKAASIFKTLSNALAIEPGHWQSQQQWGLLSLLKDHTISAENHLGKAMTLSSNRVENLLSLAALYLKEKAFQRATEVLSDAAMIDSTNWLVQSNFGFINLKHGKIHEGIRNFSKAIALGDTTVPTKYYLAESYLKLGKLSEADAIWKQLTIKYPNHIFGKLSELNRNLIKSGVKKDYSSITGDVFLEDGSTCKKVIGGTFKIIEPATSFPDTVGRVYVWIRLKGVPANGLRIVPEWFWRDQLIFRGAKGWRVGRSGRTYGYKTIGKKQTGLWHVDFYIKGTNQIVGRIDFTVYDSKTAR